MPDSGLKFIEAHRAEDGVRGKATVDKALVLFDVDIGVRCGATPVGAGIGADVTSCGHVALLLVQPGIFAEHTTVIKFCTLVLVVRGLPSSLIQLGHLGLEFLGTQPASVARSAVLVALALRASIDESASSGELQDDCAAATAVLGLSAIVAIA